MPAITPGLMDQLGDKKVICEDFIDKRWIKTMECWRKGLEALKKLRLSAGKEVRRGSFDDSDQSEDDVIDICQSEPAF